jgi:hypothetical protein
VQAMPAVSSREVSKSLIELLVENGGSLSNTKARELLADKTGLAMGSNLYDRIKDHLIAKGEIRRGKGRGGSICLMNDSETIYEDTSNTPKEEQPTLIKESAQKFDAEERIDSLQGSLEFIPGLLVKRDGRVNNGLTLFFGDDSDKIFAHWEDSMNRYVLHYKIEKDKPNHSGSVEAIFRGLASKPEDVEVDRRGVKLSAGQSVSSVHKLCRLLRRPLDEISLDNSPKNLRAGRGGAPLDETYYTEIATIIKFSVEAGLKWPLVNWRQALCFDDVDRITVIGESNNARENPHREHIVPVSMIKRQAVLLAAQGAPISVIADFIRHHLYVVLINVDEASLLDQPPEGGGLGLKDNMPQDWIWGDDPLERIAAAGIQINMTRAAVPLWKPWRKRVKDHLKEFLFGKESWPTARPLVRGRLLKDSNRS